MKKSGFNTILSVSCALASLVLINEAKADGTEQLGPPSIPIAQGSQVLVAGIGLVDSQPGNISIAIPTNSSIAQVLLYWAGRPNDDDMITVNSADVTGTYIGSGDDIQTYRADITTNNWIMSGQTNVLSVGGLDFTGANDGAAVVVILNDGSQSDIQIRDGGDLAYLPWGAQTEPVDIPVVPSANPRVGTMSLIVSDIDVPRPAAVKIIVGGVTNLLDNIFQNTEGDFMNIVTLNVPVPAGVTNVTAQVLSINDGSGLVPASLSWNFVSWTLPEPPPPEGCTYTIGYWKNHPEDWPTTNSLSIYTGEEAMQLLWEKPKGGNAYIILAHQYIGAELNVLNGASIPNEVLAAWEAAQGLLEDYMSDGVIPKHTSDRDMAIYLAGVLDDYNNGLLGPCHCD